MHGAQGVADLSLARHNSQERFTHRGLVDETPVDHVKPAAETELQLGAEFSVMLLGQEKDAYQPQWFFAERGGGDSFQFAVFQHKAVNLFAMGGSKG